MTEASVRPPKQKRSQESLERVLDASTKLLEEKGHIRHEQEGTRYVYLPRVKRDHARRSALRHVLNTFFEGSATQAIAALIDEDSGRLSDADWERLAGMIERARKEGG